MKIKLIMVVSHVRKRLVMTIMKTFILLFCTTAFGFSPGIVFSQEKINIEKEKVVTVDEVFTIIKKQTKYIFLYPDDLFKNSPKVHLNKGKVELQKLLELSVPKKDFDFELSTNKTIIIKKRPAGASAKKANQKNRVVGGIVKDNNGNLLPGVNVHVSGESDFVMTDYDGSYSIWVSNDDVLVFSYLGFVSQQVIVGNSQERYDIILKENVSSLDEIVVVGYGRTTQRFNTGSVSTLSKKDIERQPVSNVLKTLEGTIPGVDVVNTEGGYASSQVQITIRGKKDLYSSA